VSGYVTHWLKISANQDLFYPTISMQTKIWYLKKAELFKGLSEAQMAEVAASSAMLRCQRRHRFYFTDDDSDRVYLVKEGKIRLERTNEDGREILLDILGPGEIFGELALADEGTRSHSAEAIEESLVCSFERDRFLAILQRNPELAFRVVKLIGFRFRQLEARFENLVFKPLAERLCFTLEQLARRHGIADPSGGVRLPLTQKDLATLIGASREAVAEELARLKRAGLVQTGYRSLLLLHPDRLC